MLTFIVLSSNLIYFALYSYPHCQFLQFIVHGFSKGEQFVKKQGISSINSLIYLSGIALSVQNCSS
jgi:hypothetical protein